MLLQLVELRLDNLDLDLVSNTELVLDVLSTAHAPKDAATDHNAHLGRQRLCLFHRVSRQDHS